MKKLFLLDLLTALCLMSQYQSYVPAKNDERIKVAPIIDSKVYSFDLKVSCPEIGRYNVIYPIPGELIKDKPKITLRIEANYNKTAGRIFGCRIMKEMPKEKCFF